MCIWSTSWTSVYFCGASLHAHPKHMPCACLNVLTQVEVYVQGERVSLDTQLITLVCTSVRELASVLKHSSPSPYHCHFSV